MVSILAELRDNRAALDRVVNYHEETSKKFAKYSEDLTEDASGNITFIEAFSIVATRGIQRPDVRRTAWNLNSGRGAIAEFEYEKAYQLAGIYDLQASGVEYTWKTIAQKLTSREALEPKSTRVMAQSIAYAFEQLAA